MADEQRVKFGYLLESEINQAISESRLQQYSIIFTSDSKRQFILDDKLNKIEIKSRIEVFDSVDDARLKLNIDSSTYVGQIVSIYDAEQECYVAYSVQKNGDVFFVRPVHSPNDYNQLINTPFKNDTNGTSDNPTIIKDLDDGNYMISGVFITPDNKRNTSLIGHQFVVETKDNIKYITHISSSNIEKYNILLETGEVVSDEYVTESRIEGLVEKYIEEGIEDQIDKVLDDKLIRITDDEINDVFEN